ncbi:MAG TPA: hypothetical protein VME46_24630 [Acidimicrobiales bacterium]|nr:hypothetical protein [Acidimicrobiales bacterium]
MARTGAEWPAATARWPAWLAGATAMAIMGGSVRVSSTLVHAPLFAAQAARYAGAAAALLLLARARDRGVATSIVTPRGREWLWLCAIGAIGLALFNFALVRGLLYAQPAAIAVVIAGAPICLGVLGPLVQRKAPRGGLLAAGAVVTAGGVMVVGGGGTSWLGTACALLTLACEVGFTLLALPVLPRHGAWGVSFHSAWMAAAMLAGLGAATEGFGAVTRLSFADWAATATMAAMTVVAFLCWYLAVGRLGAGRAGVLTGVAPVAAALTTLASGGDVPSPLAWAGMGVVAGGLALSIVTAQRERLSPEFVRPTWWQKASARPK